MDNAIISFLSKTENKLQTIRSGVLVCRQGYPTSSLEEQLATLPILSDAASSLGLMSIAHILKFMKIEAETLLRENPTFSDRLSRALLDLLANTEAEVVKAKPDDTAFADVTDFIDQSFDMLQMRDGGSSNINDIQNQELMQILPDEFVTELTSVSIENESGLAEISSHKPVAELTTQADEDTFEIDSELLEIFGAEAEDLLTNIETNLDELIKSPVNRDALWEIRRNAHTFKGAAGIVGLQKPSKLAHRIEDLLDHLAQKEITPDKTTLDLLTLATASLRTITGGDVSQGSIARMDAVYLMFDEVMSELTNPTPKTIAIDSPVPQDVIEEAPELELALGESATQVSPDSEPILNAVSKGPAESLPVKARPIVRVSIARLDELVSIVRQLVVGQSVIEQKIREFERQIEELHNTTRRLQATTAKIESDYEASMLGNQRDFTFLVAAGDASEHGLVDDVDHFDSLELDRYTDFHQSSRALSEVASDGFSINTALEALKGSLEMAFDDQRRSIEELQEKVLQIRLIQFGSLTTRLQRVVRAACDEENKKAELRIENHEVELDTDVLDSLVESLMHLLRNAVVHGIEPPETRRLLGKSEAGDIAIKVSKEDTHVSFEVSDDGRGISASSLKERALAAGLISKETLDAMTPAESLNLMFLPGLSTAEKLSMNAGRGVGMSIVKESVESKHGSIAIDTEIQSGTTFKVKLPLSYAVAQIALVKVEKNLFAIPLKLVKQIVDLDPTESSSPRTTININDVDFATRHLRDIVFPGSRRTTNKEHSAAVLIETAELRVAVEVDEVIRTEEIVIKNLGKPLDSFQGVVGAAILGSGDVVPILDVEFLLKKQPTLDEVDEPTEPKTITVLIVDDSPSVRHMTSKVIKTAGWEALTAKDGVEAIEFLRSAPELPDVLLSDIEMPRMDGYELLAALKNDEQLKDLPVIMITSRAGDKHRDKGIELGAANYLAKPYDDFELIYLVKQLAEKDSQPHETVELIEQA